jgi:uncharacterized membrane protein YqgA involved in biofilm formation
MIAVTLWHAELAPTVNAGAVALGSVLGASGLKGLGRELRGVVLQAVSLSVIALGASMTLGGRADPLLWVAATVLGGLAGQGLRLEERLEAVSRRLDPGADPGTGVPPSQGFVLATLVFCVGPLAILGALRSGLSGNGGLLYAKSLLDGVTSLFLASSLGWGVLGSAVPVLVYEGGIALGARLVAPLLSPAAVTALTQVGGLLVVAIGLNMLLDAKIKVGNLLPALVWAVVFAWALPHLRLAP